MRTIYPELSYSEALQAADLKTYVRLQVDFTSPAEGLKHQKTAQDYIVYDIPHFRTIINPVLIWFYPRK